MCRVGNIFQSHAWATFHRNLGSQVFEASGEGWSYVAVLRERRIGRFLDCPYGPLARTVGAFDAALADLVQLAAAEKCFFVRVQPVDIDLTEDAASPEEALGQRRLHRAPYDVMPVDTRIIDLTQDEETILGDMTSKIRKVHRNIYKKGVTFTESTDPADIELLLPILEAVARRKQFVRKTDSYLREAAKTLMPLGVASLYIAWLNGEPVDVTLVYDWEGTRIQAHGGADARYEHLYVSHALLVRMILDAKAKDLHWFDMFGAAPVDAGPEHPYWGYSEFKKNFGGEPVTHPGAWDLPLHSLRYRGTYALRSALKRGDHLRERLLR